MAFAGSLNLKFLGQKKVCLRAEKECIQKIFIKMVLASQIVGFSWSRLPGASWGSESFECTVFQCRSRFIKEVIWVAMGSFLQLNAFHLLLRNDILFVLRHLIILLVVLLWPRKLRTLHDDIATWTVLGTKRCGMVFTERMLLAGSTICSISNHFQSFSSPHEVYRSQLSHPSIPSSLWAQSTASL